MAKEPRPSHEDGKFNPETGDFEDIVDGPGTFGDANIPDEINRAEQAAIQMQQDQKRATKSEEMDQNLTPSQRGLLQWLSEAEYSQYGECHGKDLDRLVALGLAQIHKNGEHTEGFIAAPRSAQQLADPMYQAVSLTPAGRTLRNDQ